MLPPLSEADQQPEPRYIHYFIVVHGIGEQRPNETVLSTINRMAEARACDVNGKFPPKNAFVSMGKVAAQAGTSPGENGRLSFAGDHPWTQFEGIPINADEYKNTFNGRQSRGTCDIRFVDMFWADILDEYNTVSGQDVSTWTNGVISRLENAGELSEDRLWVMKTLEQVQETALFVNNIAHLPFVNKGKALDHIMEKVVGDIQVYGENRSVRGRAVRRFHDLMEKLHKHHYMEHVNHLQQATNNGVDSQTAYCKAEESNGPVFPKYHILAHSLGTVMAFDAIMFGHVTNKMAYGLMVKGGVSPYRNIPFEQYYADSNLASSEADMFAIKDLMNRFTYVGGNWIHNVDSFTTLGSPLDKFLTLWPENYDYLKFARYDGQLSNMDELLSDRKGMAKIRHYNYCDEMDPVGHHLDFLSSQPAYNRIFEYNRDRDVVFNQYCTPGVAHVKYWDDQELFQRILHQTVDKKPEADPEGEAGESELISGEAFAESRARLKHYWKVITNTYFIPTAVAAIVMSVLFYLAWINIRKSNDPDAEKDLLTMVLAVVGLVLSGMFFQKVIALLIWWRQVLRKKSLRRMRFNKKAKSNKEYRYKQYRQKYSSFIFKLLLVIGFVFFMGCSIWLIIMEVASNPKNTDISVLGVFAFLLLGSWALIKMVQKFVYARKSRLKNFNLGARLWTLVLILIIATSVLFIKMKLGEGIASGETLGDEGTIAGKLRSKGAQDVMQSIVALMGSHDLWVEIKSESSVLWSKLRLPLAILTTAISISWLYMVTTLLYVKKELRSMKPKA